MIADVARLRISFVTETVTQSRQPATETVTVKGETVTKTQEAITVTLSGAATTVTKTQPPKTIVQTVIMSNVSVPYSNSGRLEGY